MARLSLAVGGPRLSPAQMKFTFTYILACFFYYFDYFFANCQFLRFYSKIKDIRRCLIIFKLAEHKIMVFEPFFKTKKCFYLIKFVHFLSSSINKLPYFSFPSLIDFIKNIILLATTLAFLKPSSSLNTSPFLAPNALFQ